MAERSKRMSIDKELLVRLNVNRNEIYRYMGIKNGQADEQTIQYVESCLKELEAAVTPRMVYREFPLKIEEDGTLDFTCFKVQSKNLRKNLEGCDRVLLFAATLGSGADYLIRRYGKVQVSRSVMMQAASAAMIEAYCNLLNDDWKKKAAAEGYYLRPRFSPGYGDFPLEMQPLFLDVLKAEKTTGITLTDALLMMPSKSVTAVIGMGRENTNCEPEGCEVCGKTNCEFRRS